MTLLRFHYVVGFHDELVNELRPADRVTYDWALDHLDALHAIEEATLPRIVAAGTPESVREELATCGLPLASAIARLGNDVTVTVDGFLERIVDGRKVVTRAADGRVMSSFAEQAKN